VFLPLNLNTASRAEILLIPGMTDDMAYEFEEYRPYTAMRQFQQEIGKYVDDAEVARLEQYVFVPMNLNQAGPEALATIPGLTESVVDALIANRPYASIEAFRAEAGAQFGDDAVTRLERYVFLR
jgi:radical SAM superfamily enzyme with C-terminal helix-hairpin-helix motif